MCYLFIMTDNGTEANFRGENSNNDNESDIEIVYTSGKHLIDLIKRFEILSQSDISHIPIRKNKPYQNIKEHINYYDESSKLLESIVSEKVDYQNRKMIIKSQLTDIPTKNEHPVNVSETKYTDKPTITYVTDQCNGIISKEIGPLDTSTNINLFTIRSEDQKIKTSRMRIVTFDLSITDYVYYDKDSESSDEYDNLFFP